MLSVVIRKKHLKVPTTLISCVVVTLHTGCEIMYVVCSIKRALARSALRVRDNACSIWGAASVAKTEALIFSRVS